MVRNYEKNWFEYKGRYYGYGTIVKFKPEIYKGMSYIPKLNGVLEFCNGSTNGWISFKSTDPSIKCRMANYWNPNDVIEYIIKPVYVTLQPVWKNAVKNYNEAAPEHKHLAFPGTLWYIAAMIVGTLFNARLLIWIMATIIYGIYWINQYRD